MSLKCKNCGRPIKSKEPPKFFKGEPYGPRCYEIVTGYSRKGPSRSVRGSVGFTFYAGGIDERRSI
jgi:hypothetical protein